MEFIYDPARPDFQECIYDVYRTLRNEYPVYHNETTDIWALSRFDDLRRAYAMTQELSSEGVIPTMSVGVLPMMLELDPPYHDQVRAIVSKGFTPRRVSQLEPAVRRIARGLIDSFLEKGECDLVHDFCRELPSRVISHLIGVPEERQGTLLDWSEAILVAPREGSFEHFLKIQDVMIEEFTVLLEERRRERRDDLMSALLDAEVDGRRLSREELLGMCYLLVAGGSDPSTNLIASGATLLAKHPDQRSVLAREPQRIPDAVEEMLRFEGPAQANNRRVTRDVEFHGTTIPAGAQLKLVIGAANRDERQFEAPDRFDGLHKARRNLGFGEGVHFCLGASLVRLEARVAFEELLASIPDYELRSEPGWTPSLWARAHEEVLIRFDPVGPRGRSAA